MRCPAHTISQYDFHSVVRPSSPWRLVGPYKLSFEPDGSPLFTSFRPTTCLRFAAAVTGHHARLGSRLLARLCRGRHRRRQTSTRLQGATTEKRPLGVPTVADRALQRTTA